MTSDEEIKYINEIERLRKENKSLKKIVESNLVVLTQLTLRVSQLKDKIFFMAYPENKKPETKEECEECEFDPDLSEVSYT